VAAASLKAAVRRRESRLRDIKTNEKDTAAAIVLFLLFGRARLMFGVYFSGTLAPPRTTSREPVEKKRIIVVVNVTGADFRRPSYRDGIGEKTSLPTYYRLARAPKIRRVGPVAVGRHARV